MYLSFIPSLHPTSPDAFWDSPISACTERVQAEIERLGENAGPISVGGWLPGFPGSRLLVSRPTSSGGGVP
eukprot:9397155-Pyramimonas_sp.AAC.1